MPLEQEGKKDFIQGIHYYLEGDRVIFTSLFHLERGQCCGNGCRHCAYEPRHVKGTKILDEKFAHLKKKS
jgi:hypothetical protein